MLNESECVRRSQSWARRRVRIFYLIPGQTRGIEGVNGGKAGPVGAYIDPLGGTALGR